MLTPIVIEIMPLIERPLLEPDDRLAVWRRQRARVLMAERCDAPGPRENRAPRYGARNVNDDMMSMGA